MAENQNTNHPARGKKNAEALREQRRAAREAQGLGQFLAVVEAVQTNGGKGSAAEAQGGQPGKFRPVDDVHAMFSSTRGPTLVTLPAPCVMSTSPGRSSVRRSATMASKSGWKTTSVPGQT